MALTLIKFAPGIDKQDTAVGAVGRWVDSDNVRFRYGLPEKIGGWASLLNETVVGVTRKILPFVDQTGNRYLGIGTDKFLLIYFEGQLFDITPFRSDGTGAQITFTSSTLSTDSTTTKQCTITTSTNHGLIAGDMIVLDAVTLPSGTGLADADFEDKLFQVLTAPTPTTFTIDSLNQATAIVATGGSMTVEPYASIGPASQTYGYGFGVGQYGGTVPGASITTINNSGTFAAGATSVILTDSSVFPASGTLLIGDELMTYTTNTIGTDTISGITRGQFGTSDVTHADGATVTNATDFTGWGSAVLASTVILEPGLWSLDNFGDVLVATIANGKTFTWDSSIAARLSTRASQLTPGFETTNNPVASRVTLVSPTTRHLIHLGTCITLNDEDTQDDMFLRFSTTEGINEYDIKAINTAGSFRLQDGTKIIGALKAKETILIWTDNALYTMKFVGAPFTFGFEQVGTNCGLIGKNAAVEIDGIAYWMSNNGFFAFDGTVKSLPCSVEDYVYDDIDTTKGQQINAGLNNLFTEIVWWYPTQGSTFNNRAVAYNYTNEGQQIVTGIWYTTTNQNSIRTSWSDSLIYPKPYATKYNSLDTGTFPTVIGESGLGQSVLFEHETGTDQINPDGTTTTLTSFVQSYDVALQTDQGVGEYFLSMNRFLPDFKILTGNCTFTLNVSDFPQSTPTNSSLSPFIITSSTNFVSTRARGRYASIKIENTGAGENWRYGTLQVDLRPDGRR
jgi:hypothetical protein